MKVRVLHGPYQLRLYALLHGPDLEVKLYIWGGMQLIKSAKASSSKDKNFNFGKTTMVTWSTSMAARSLCEGGGIGRRTGFRFQRGDPWGFDSPSSYSKNPLNKY